MAGRKNNQNEPFWLEVIPGKRNQSLEEQEPASQGILPLPPDVLEACNWQEGFRLEMQIKPDHRVEVKALAGQQQSIFDPIKPPPTPEEG